MRSFQSRTPGATTPPPAVLRAPDYVDARVLAANTAETHTKPDGATVVSIKATADTYITYIENAEDTDLVTNGAFAADTDWTKGTGWTISGGKADCDGSQVGASSLEQTPTGDNAVLEGKAYSVVFTVSSYSAGNVAAKLGGGTAGTNRASDATFTETLIAGSDGKIEMVADADFVGKIDTLSVAPIAHIPTADQITGNASELILANTEIVRNIATVASISMISAGTPKVVMAFFGD